ncbi:protein FAR1-RELATED SEQUENCE 5-like [Olea europaea var. sylvestris]|uniref:protein FAR1-RELATED SEQUENCE 5-like n=1 Tax=Olea europaea var. sylvestris TaxID=158386 RepID=UPI000C1D7508|nr:protein FAR1-RELATED SEQUENCE 5-like [Olea europaea var. sylvestris]
MEDVVDNSLADSENENAVKKTNLVEEEGLGDGDSIVPEVGMQFNDEKEMFEFYKRYAHDVGFPIQKRNSKKGDDGLLKYVIFTCSRKGQRNTNVVGSLKPQPMTQTDCKARISTSSNVNGTWRINTVNLKHNHTCSPSKSWFYHCNRKLPAHVKRKLEVNNMAGIPLHKSFNSAVVEAGGYENLPCVEKDCRNYIEQARREFGDVVSFHTTYLTNKYDMPFAPFVRVNHRGQSTLLGCGLLSNEDTDTFVWVFKTWLECMHGQAPHGIITDQDRAMQNAIQIVFPNTKHRWCLWHILKKLPEKFGYNVDKGNIFSTIHRLVYDSQTGTEFEKGWGLMIDEYELHDNDWLAGLYNNRAH